jgi:hypothetical protein
LECSQLSGVLKVEKDSNSDGSDDSEKDSDDDILTCRYLLVRGTCFKVGGSDGRRDGGGDSKLELQRSLTCSDSNQWSISYEVVKLYH